MKDAHYCRKDRHDGNKEANNKLATKINHSEMCDN